MTDSPVSFNGTPSVNTPTSPNTNVVTTPTFDTNNTTSLSFEYQGRIPVWTPQVSQSITTAVLGSSISIGSTTWRKGLKVTYNNLGADQYTVTLDGTIIDNGTAYKHTGTTLGIFKRHDQSGQTRTEIVEEDAPHGLPEAVFIAPSSVNTPTSPNTNVITTPTFDTNNTTNLSFQYQGRIPVWTPQVSQAIPEAKLGDDRSIGDTTWKKGLTVRYSNLNANQYTVTITNGRIIDNGTVFNQVGTTLGIFSRNDD
ncbi:MAG: hypothetical protein AAF772_17950 [Acidobacteriota bacterium]